MIFVDFAAVLVLATMGNDTAAASATTANLETNVLNVIIIEIRVLLSVIYHRLQR